MGSRNEYIEIKNKGNTMKKEISIQMKYMIEKNKIVFDVTGLVLIPAGQLMDVVWSENQQNFGEEESLYSTNCPYCLEFHEYDCRGCPMHEAGNGCMSEKNTTWRSAIDSWENLAENKDREKLRQLGRKYKKLVRQDNKIH